MKTSKYYLVGLTAIVVSLMCCGPMSAEYICVQDFDSLTANQKLVGQDNWVVEGSNSYTYVKAEASANKHGYDANWTGFSGNVADCGTDSQLTRANGGDWSLSIPSNSTEVTLSYTLFTRGSYGNVAGIRMGGSNLFYFGAKPGSDEWRSWSLSGSAYSGTGVGLSSVYKSYAVTAVLDLTDPTKVLADMWVENLTDGGAAVEVLSDINLGLTGTQLDPANWDGFYVRFNQGVMDNLTVTAIPEPSTLALLATGLIGLLCYAWRKRK